MRPLMRRALKASLQRLNDPVMKKAAHGGPDVGIGFIDRAGDLDPRPETVLGVIL